MPKSTIPSLFSQPSAFFQPFQRELAQMMDQVRGSFPGSEDDAFFAQPFGAPAVDVAETETGLEITAEVPGVAEEDLDVTIQGDTLVLKGKKSAETEDKQKAYHLVERRYGSFSRHIPLGFVPADGAVKAEFANGVLKLDIARPEDAAAGIQKITIGQS